MVTGHRKGLDKEPVVDIHLPSRECFAWLTPTTFLQTIATQSIEIGGNRCAGQYPDPLQHIEQLGLGASRCFEEAFRKELAIDGPLDHETYAALILEIKNKIGGNFSRTSSEPGTVRVTNTCCPFGEAVKNTPNLCQMTSSVFGGIAARNFGYAKVVLHKRIAVNDDTCEVSVVTDPAVAQSYQGDEYRYHQGMIVGKTTYSEANKRIQRRMTTVWCNVKAGIPNHEEITRPLVVAQSDAMRKTMEMIEIVAPTSATVLITGETGVGKEVVARVIHALSERRGKHFIAVNCGAIPENLVESALFGHERGAFTGAYEVHHGYFERAEGGTLFLDEIDSLPLAAQVRLLRVLQEGEFERVGGKLTYRAEARVIAAGSEKLEEFVKKGQFRRDLFYRLNVVPIFIPPLRERPDDIAALTEIILGKLSRKYTKSIHALSPQAMILAMTYNWPGNVRELENVLERSFLFATDPVINQLRFHNGEEHDQPHNTPPLESSLKATRKQAADQAESCLLNETLARFNGNITAVAKHLHLTTRAVHKKLHAHQIDSNFYRRKIPLPTNGDQRLKTLPS